MMEYQLILTDNNVYEESTRREFIRWFVCGSEYGYSLEFVRENWFTCIGNDNDWFN